MQTIGALALSVFTLVSTFVMTPSKYIQSNVLGDETSTVSSEIKTNKPSNKDIEAHKAELRKQKEALKENLKTQKEALKTTKEAKKAQLNLIKDTKKKQAAERICTKVASLNENYSNHLSNFSTHLSDLISKIETRLASSTQNGNDTTSCQALLDTARVSIATAQTAIQAQSAKSYSCPTIDDTTAKSTLKSLHETLKNDLAMVKSQTQTARQALKDVASCISVFKTNEDSSVETSPTP